MLLAAWEREFPVQRRGASRFHGRPLRTNFRRIVGCCIRESFGASIWATGFPTKGQVEGADPHWVPSCVPQSVRRGANAGANAVRLPPRFHVGHRAWVGPSCGPSAAHSGGTGRGRRPIRSARWAHEPCFSSTHRRGVLPAASAAPSASTGPLSVAPNDQVEIPKELLGGSPGRRNRASPTKARRGSGGHQCRV